MARERELFADDRGVFMISVAAELAGMHPQTLRIYESRGLIKPTRSPKRTRLYSRRDVERLKRIQQLTNGFGMNLAGVERVLALEEVMESMQQQVERLRGEARAMEAEMRRRIAEVHRSYKRELVPWQRPGQMVRVQDAGDKAFRIPIQRRPRPEQGDHKPHPSAEAIDDLRSS